MVGGASERGSREAHLLAISDLHLGHDLKRGLTRQAGVLPLDRHLGAFLDHYRTHREGSRPWRLIIVGDMVDFIAITLTPDASESVAFSVTAAERDFGLGTEPEKARWKLEQVMGRHAWFCARLAHFLADGNEVVIVRGNHDPEWSWAEVQECFRAGVARLAPDGIGSSVRERIQFCDWFYLEPGRFYAEHGHLYDEFAVTDDTPRLTQGAQRLSESVSTQAQRYFANHYTSLDMNEVERWSLWDYVRWAWHGAGLLRTFGDYLTMCRRVLTFSFRARRAHRREEERLERLRAALCAVRAEYVDLARSLLAVARRPAELSLLTTARMLYFDRLVLVLATGVLLASCSAVASSSTGRSVALLSIIVAAAGGDVWLRRARVVDSHPKLLKAAKRVAEIFRVPIVVMGHSHRVVDEEVGTGSRYYNLGTWLAPSVGDSGAGFPHVVVDASGHSIRRWPTTPVTP